MSTFCGLLSPWSGRRQYTVLVAATNSPHWPDLSIKPTYVRITCFLLDSKCKVIIQSHTITVYFKAISTIWNRMAKDTYGNCCISGIGDIVDGTLYHCEISSKSHWGHIPSLFRKMMLFISLLYNSSLFIFAYIYSHQPYVGHAKLSCVQKHQRLPRSAGALATICIYHSCFHDQGPLLLTSINFNPNMDKYAHALSILKWN